MADSSFQEVKCQKLIQYNMKMSTLNSLVLLSHPIYLWNFFCPILEYFDV